MQSLIQEKKSVFFVFFVLVHFFFFFSNVPRPEERLWAGLGLAKCTSSQWMLRHHQRLCKLPLYKGNEIGKKNAVSMSEVVMGGLVGGHRKAAVTQIMTSTSKLVSVRSHLVRTLVLNQRLSLSALLGCANWGRESVLASGLTLDSTFLAASSPKHFSVIWSKPLWARGEAEIRGAVNNSELRSGHALQVLRGGKRDLLKHLITCCCFGVFLFFFGWKVLLAAGVPGDSNLHRHCHAINSDLCKRHAAAYQLSVSACITIDLSVVLPMEHLVDADGSHVASL